MKQDTKETKVLALAEQVTLVAKKALKLIVSQRQLPWPNVYEKEFWGVCYRDKIEDLLKKKFEIKEAPRIVVEQFLSDTEKILNGVHETVDQFVGDAHTGIRSMGTTIDVITGMVGDDIELRQELSKLATYTEDMRERVEATEKKLLEQSRTIKELKGRLRLDPLTGLLNRHALISDLKKELNRSNRYDVPLSIIMIDIDDFKDINDTYGHVTGDKLLKRAAEIMKESIRDSDSLYRYGGEEFMVLCTHTNCESAVLLGERLRNQVRRYRFLPVKGSNKISISISLGVTGALKNDGPDSLIRRADEALYRSKLSGKDQTTKNCV